MPPAPLHMERQMDNKEVHIGDGLYAFVDDWGVTIRAPQYKGPDTYLSITPEVLAALNAVMQNWRKTK